MDNISSWVRQARHRAKKHGVSSTLTTEEAAAIINIYGDICAYCPEAMTTLDHIIPLADSGPNVQANILPCCRHCKFVKRNRSIVWMFGEGLITDELYMRLVSDALTRNGSPDVRAAMRQAVGLIREGDDV